ncbi:MAG: S8 family serine peptidase [Pirellulaceae bacterium]
MTRSIDSRASSFSFLPFLRFPRLKGRLVSERMRRLAGVELLEDRSLLAVDVGTQPIGSWEPVAIQLPTSSSSTSRELERFVELSRAVELGSTGSANLQSAIDEDGLNVDAVGRVVVRVTTSDAEALTPLLEQRGMEVIASLADHNLIEGYVPASALSNIIAAKLPGLLGIVPVYKPQVGKGSVADQADYVMEADRVRAALPTGYNGSGVKVAVLSDSYDTLEGAAADIASGDLPSNVFVLRDATSGIDEGRAMLQLVHDIAPGASLAFADVLRSEADFAQQIRRLANPNGPFGADIIVDDIFFFGEPMFQDGLIAQAIDDVVNQREVAYFALAGNLEDQAYRTGNFGAAFDPAFPGFFHDFDPSFGIDTRQRISIPANANIVLTLQWDDPFFTTNGVDTDLNIFLLAAGTNTVVASSFDSNISNQTPREILRFTNQSSTIQQFDVLIQLAAGPQPGLIKYVNYGRNGNSGIVFQEYATNSPTVVPHGATTRGLGVGAVHYWDRDQPTEFSSQGLATILFDDNGNRLTNVDFRFAPQIAAIQGTDTTFFGSDLDGNGKPNFTGTSAAAPHAAAIAALVLDANPNFKPNDVYNALISTATDIGAPGFDAYTGWGLINAWDAIFGDPTRATIPVTENFNNGDLPAYFQINGTGDSRTLVTTQNGPRGNRHLRMDSGNRSETGLNELILNVDAAGISNVKLTFWQKEFNDNNHSMPLSFTGSHNSDGVAFSVDGVTWHRLVNLVGTTSKNSYSKFGPINISAVAKNKGLTLGRNLQIKFQQFGANDVTGDGFAFDDISVTGERRFFFTAKLTADQRELFVSTGTAAGTKLVKNLGGTTSSDPQELTMVGDTLFFTAEDASGQRELYRSNGTAAGTGIVANLSGATSADPKQLTAVGDHLYFTALLANGQRELFVSDGTATGTRLVRNLSGTVSSVPLELTAYKNQLYFTAKLANGQRELFQSNGTVAGTKLVSNLSGSVSADPKGLTVAGNTLYFSAAKADGDRELFKSNGFRGGTVLVKDLAGAAASDPQELTAVGALLYFSALLSNGQRELHKSNGTSAGTLMVRNLTGATSADPQQLTAVGNRVFFTAIHSNGNRELFVSNGSSSGTKITKDLSGSVSSNPGALTALGNQVFFSATLVGGQRELHRSNGNNAGTVLVENLSGAVSANPTQLTEVGGVLFFAAKHVGNNVELFSSNGTAAGTGILRNLSGGVSSQPAVLTPAPLDNSGASGAGGGSGAATALVVTSGAESTNMIDGFGKAEVANTVWLPTDEGERLSQLIDISQHGTEFTGSEYLESRSSNGTMLNESVDEVFAQLDDLMLGMSAVV